MIRPTPDSTPGPNRRARRCQALALLALALLALAGCGPKLVRGEPPFVDIASWQIEGARLALALRVRNVNGEALPVRALDLDLSLDGAPLASFATRHDLAVAANGFETLRLSAAATAEGRTLLEKLEQGERASLPYLLDGSVVTEGGKRLEIRREGHVYPVPGRPGQFR